MASQEVADEYRSSLSDLTLNSKPLITMLTMLAEENLSHASVIVKVIVKQIHTCSNKLPLMYLIDSILKNVGKDYIKLFAQNIIDTFTFVFEKVDEKTRKKLYELRHTWNDVFAKSKLYMLDTKVQSVDPAWPVAAGPAGSPATSKPNIHINPNLISGVVKGASRPSSSGEKDLKDLEILKREEEILELKKKRILLEQKKKDIEKSRYQQKAEPEVAKPEPAKPVPTKPVLAKPVPTKPVPTKPVSKPSEDPSVSSDRRAEFLRSYKIKKKSQSQVKEEAKVSSNIHVDPRRVHQVLPQVAASVPVTSRDPRNEGSRDPRIKVEKSSRDPRIPPESSRDPRIKPEVPRVKPEASRDPRLGAAEPVSASNNTPSKTTEPQVTPSRDPRVLNKEPDKKVEVTKSKKEPPVKRKKAPPKSEAQKSEAQKSIPQKSVPQKSETREPRETRSTKPTPRAKEIPPKPKPAEVPDTSTPFKCRKSKRRPYMQREESPDEKNSSQSSSGKRSRGDRSSGSDSEDSDHYVGNVPNQSQYKQSGKKVKKPDVNNPPVISDTDYRHFTPPKRPTTTTENVSPPKKDKIMEEDPPEPPPQGLGLFSNKDVDYRQILPRPLQVMPTPNIPPPVPQVFSTKDQDDRKPGNMDIGSLDPLTCLNSSENPDLSLAGIKGEMAPPDAMNTPLRSMENRMKKPSFNSPHAASWEKFRDKNPEFKEYTRQASISDVEGMHSLYEEELEDVESPRHSESARENYKVILSQAEDQMRRGEINMGQYNQLLTTVVTLMEQDKIQQVRDRDRHLVRTPQPQIPGSDDGTGTDGSNDSHGPPTLPSSSPGRPPPLNNTGVPIAGPTLGLSSGPPSGGPVGVHPSGIPPHPGLSVGGLPSGHPGGHPGGPPAGHPGQGLPRPGGPPTGHRPGPIRAPANNEGGGRGGRGGFMRNEMPMGPRGGMMGRGAGRGGPPGSGPETEEGWGRGGGGRGGRGRRGRGHMKENRGWGSREILEDEWTGEPELPFLQDDYLHTVDRDNITKKIEIDGVKREVRTYGQTAVVFMEWDDPRILTFGEGQVNIVFEGGIFRLTMRIGEDYKEFTFEGKKHRVRLGPPAQELMLDGTGYHCLIGGDPITVQFDGAPHSIALEGKPPNVCIGPIRNTEFVAGMIQLVIQASKFVSLFLDARPQRFSVDGRAFVIKFVDALKGVTINNQKFPVEFGGLPISICVRGYRRFLSFGNLPHGIVAGQVAIRGMEGEVPIAPRGLDKTVNVPPGRPPNPIPQSFDRPHQGSPGPVPNSIRPPGPTPQGPPMPRPGIHGPPQPPTLKGPPPRKGSPNHGPVFPGPVQGPMPQGPQQPQGPPAQGLPPHASVSHEPPPLGSQGTPVIPKPSVTLQGPPPPVPILVMPVMPGGAAPVMPGAVPVMPGALPVMPGTAPVIPGAAPVIPAAAPVIPGAVPVIPGAAPVIPGTGHMMPVPMFPFINQPPPPLGTLPPATPGSYTTTQLPPSVNKSSHMAHMPLDSLLANLQRLGWIGNKEEKEEEKKEEEEEHEKERALDERIPIELMLRSENLRKRRKWVIEFVYRGMQCSSCGLRYPPEQTVQYSHHLDWHFRKNKKQQESTKKANTRKFYFSIEDWLQYEEIEDLEERVPSMFETEGTEDHMNSEESEVPSVQVTSGSVPEGSTNTLDVCPTCHDKFPCFFHQETEEWRYRNAVQVDGLNYHPSCHQDNLREAEEAVRLEAEKEAAEKEAAEKEAAEKEAAEKEAAEKEAEEKDVAKTDVTDQEEAVEKVVVEKEGENEDAETKAGDKEKVAVEERKNDDEKEPSEIEAETQNVEEENANDTPMESQASVTEKLDGMSLAPLPPVRIKDEPMDVEDVDAEIITPVLPPGVTVKLEVKKEPEELCRIPDEDDENSLISPENDELNWTTPTVTVNAAETDIASSIDGNTELTTTDTTKTTTNKIVFNVSKPSVNNISEVHITNNDKNNDLNSNVVNEDEFEEFIPPPFTVDYDLKPAFRDVELVDQPLAARGIELSGLCSIM